MNNTLEFYFKTLTVLFWSILVCNWIFIPNHTIDYYISNIYLVLSIVYLILFIASKIKHKNLNHSDKDYIDFIYKIISIITFVISIMYFLLYSNNIKLYLIKSLVVFIYLYISLKKVIKLKDETGLVGVIGALLIFVFATYY